MIRTGLRTMGLFAPVRIAACDSAGAWACEAPDVRGINLGQMTGSRKYHTDGWHESDKRLELPGGGHPVQSALRSRSLREAIDGRLVDRPEQVSIRRNQLNREDADPGPQTVGLHAARMRGAPENSRLVPQSAEAFELVHDEAARCITCTRAQAPS